MSSELQIELPAVQESSAASPAGGTLQLSITLDVGGGCFRFEWRRAGSTEPVALGQLATTSLATFGFSDLQWSLEAGRSRAAAAIGLPPCERWSTVCTGDLRWLTSV